MKTPLKKLFTAFCFFVLTVTAYGQIDGSVQLSSFTLDKEKNTVQVAIKTTDSFHRWSKSLCASHRKSLFPTEQSPRWAT
jgi:hypothetical protein